jgi:hypothetical protein
MASGLCARRPGNKVVWRKLRKTGMVVPVVSVVIVTTPSRLKAPKTVRRFQLTGAWPNARTNCRPSRAPRHVRHDPALIQKDQTFWINRRDLLTELMPFGGNIRS